MHLQFLIFHTSVNFHNNNVELALFFSIFAVTIFPLSRRRPSWFSVVPVVGQQYVVNSDVAKPTLQVRPILYLIVVVIIFNEHGLVLLVNPKLIRMSWSVYSGFSKKSLPCIYSHPSDILLVTMIMMCKDHAVCAVVWSMSIFWGCSGQCGHALFPKLNKMAWVFTLCLYRASHKKLYNFGHSSSY